MRIKLSIASVLIAILFFGTFASASTFITPTVMSVIANSQYSPNVTYPEWSTISGNYLYYGSNWDNYITIVDITDPLHPVQMSSIHDGDTGATIKSPKGTMVVGDYAYIVNWNNTTNDESVEILNVADKSHPYHVSNYIYSIGTGDMTYSLFVKDDYIYVASGGVNKMIIIDARNKAVPVLAGSISNGTGGAKLSNVYNISVVGNYAYVTAQASNALEIIDVSNKTNPTHVSYLVNGTGGALLDGPTGLQVSGNYAYISSYRSSALEIVNISNPAAPVHSGSIVDGTNGAKIKGFEIAINGNYAYLSGYDKSAVEIVDISNPANPTHAGVVSDGVGGAALNRPRAISYYNNTVYVSVTGSNRMEIIDVTNPATAAHINQIDPSLNLGGVRFVKLHNGLAYLTSNTSNAMQIVDISDKKNPRPRGSVSLRANGAQLYGPLGLDFYGNYAYIVSTGANAGPNGASALWGALEIVDISDPDHPVHVNSIVNGIFACTATGGVENIKIVGGYAYLTLKGGNALKVLDIASNPTNPTLVGTLANGTGGASLSAPWGIDIVGNYAYITTSNALEIVNISNPVNPTHVGTLANGSGGAILTNAYYINVIGNYAYITSYGGNALEIVNISNPAAPVHAGSLTNGTGGALLASPFGIVVSENRAYIGSAGSNALEVVNVSNPASPTHMYSITDGTNGARLVSARGTDTDGDYVYVAAYNGSSNALNIIKIKEAAPTSLSYSSPKVYTKDSIITPLTPTVTGDNITYSVSPALPSGLSLATSTGIISGTPTATSTQTTYTVTATNVGGSTTFGVVMTVNNIAPTNLSYVTPNVYTKNLAITPISPTITGVELSYTISPSLPAGLSFATSTGIISGTPTTTSAQTTYTVTATNSGGSTTANLNITINNATPTNFSYVTPNVYTKNIAITSLNPTITGNEITYSILPTLPSGLSMSTSTGIISGTPTTTSAQTTYTVTATNSGGSVTFGIVLTVNNVAPTSLFYNSSNIYSTNNPIIPLNPTVTGVEITYSISPALPSGLSFNTETGIISGTPSINSNLTNYTVTATNSGGSTTANLNITVNNNVAPSPLPLAIGPGSEVISIPMNTTQNISPISPSGVNILAYINSQANFQVPGSSSNWQPENHSFKINDLDLYRNIITITISSKPQTLILKKGESREVDLDGDNKNDVLISFTNVYVNRAEITVKSLTKEVSVVKPITAPTTTIVTPVKPKTFIFTKDLKLNSSNLDVKELQKYLNANGYIIAKSGAGSRGKETATFGSATKAALIKFQKAKKISPANGLFGPVTRRIINGK